MLVVDGFKRIKHGERVTKFYSVGGTGSVYGTDYGWNYKIVHRFLVVLPAEDEEVGAETRI